LEVIALSLTAEALSIDSENRLFSKLNSDYKTDFPLALIPSRLKYANCPRQSAIRSVRRITNMRHREATVPLKTAITVPMRSNQKGY
jgi:hypothetical protein